MVRALFLVGLAALAGCSKPSPPTIAPEKASITRVDLAGIALDVSMSVTNPNSVDLTATGVSSHVVVDKTHELGNVSLPRTITLPAGKTTNVDVPVLLQWSEAGELAQLAATQESIPFTVDGTLDLGGSLVHVGVPFHLEGTLTHAQLTGALMNSLPKPR